MPGLVDCGVVLRTALPSGNALFTSLDESLQGLVASTVYLIIENSNQIQTLGGLSQEAPT